MLYILKNNNHTVICRYKLPTYILQNKYSIQIKVKVDRYLGIHYHNFFSEIFIQLCCLILKDAIKYIDFTNMQFFYAFFYIDCNYKFQ